jgi:hypothetical protein
MSSMRNACATGFGQGSIDRAGAQPNKELLLSAQAVRSRSVAPRFVSGPVRQQNSETLGPDKHYDGT